MIVAVASDDVERDAKGGRKPLGGEDFAFGAIHEHRSGAEKDYPFDLGNDVVQVVGDE
jgi:hypothetical protein